MKKITCTLGTIDKAITELEWYMKDLDGKTRKLMERLAEIGVETATLGFGKAVYAGTNDVVVEPFKWVGDKLIISARGNAVAFIEFGTGVHYSTPHPKAAELGMTRGTYGYKLGRLDSWRYKGDPGNEGQVITEGKHKGEVLTHGNPAARAMYDAGKDMRENIVEVAKEVFGKND